MARSAWLPAARVKRPAAIGASGGSAGERPQGDRVGKRGDVEHRCGLKHEREILRLGGRAERRPEERREQRRDAGHPSIGRSERWE